LLSFAFLMYVSFVVGTPLPSIWFPPVAYNKYLFF
jgi:hypothetical protein